MIKRKLPMKQQTPSSEIAHQAPSKVGGDSFSVHFNDYPDISDTNVYHSLRVPALHLL